MSRRPSKRERSKGISNLITYPDLPMQIMSELYTQNHHAMNDRNIKLGRTFLDCYYT